jgi:hypothetical protein
VPFGTRWTASRSPDEFRDIQALWARRTGRGYDGADPMLAQKR